MLDAIAGLRPTAQPPSGRRAFGSRDAATAGRLPNRGRGGDHRGNTTSSRAVIRACRPFHRRDQYPKVNMPPPDPWAEAKKKWGYTVSG